LAPRSWAVELLGNAAEQFDLFRTTLNLMGWPLPAAPGDPGEDGSAFAPLPLRW
jgi:hypothetical protein